MCLCTSSLHSSAPTILTQLFPPKNHNNLRHCLRKEGKFDSVDPRTTWFRLQVFLAQNFFSVSGVRQPRSYAIMFKMLLQLFI